MSKYETPDYAVIISEAEFEIREYTDFYIVEYDNDQDPRINQGFGTLFSYISDNNKVKQKLSMTVPVIEEISGDKKKMAFVISAKYRDNVPEPNDNNLKIKKFNEGKFAVIKYSGFSNEKTEEIMKTKLSAWLMQKGYIIDSNYMLAFYNAPFTLPMFRRNEIMVRVK